MQSVIKFEVFGYIIAINIDSNSPGAYIFRSALGFYDNLLLTYRSTPPAEALVGVSMLYKIIWGLILYGTFSLIRDSV